PWIYDRALAPERPRRASRETMAGGPGRPATVPPIDVEISAGDIVEIIDDDGAVATAFADPASPIRARVLGEPELEPDDAWAEARVSAAAACRVRDPLLAGCTGRRLVHGEADGCPGLVVDAYDDTAVVVLDGAAESAFWRTRMAGVLAGLDRHDAL